MWNRIQNSRGFFIFLSVVIAIVCWFYVDITVEPDIHMSVRNIPVTYDGLDELESQGLMLEEGGDATVTLNLVGKRSAVAQVNRSNIAVTVDAGNQITGPGVQRLEYDVTFPTSVNNSGIRISSRSVSAIDVTVVQSTTRSVPVVGNFTGSVESGYMAGDFTLQYRQINITGDETLVGQVDHAQVTLSQSGLSADWEGTLPVALINKAGDHLPEEDVERLDLSHEEMDVAMDVRRVKELRLTVDIKDGGGATEEDVICTIQPEHIRVSGSEKALSKLSEWKLGTVDLSQVITSEQLTYNLNLPDGIRCESGEESAVVSVKLPKLTTIKLETTNVKLLNAPEDRTVTLLNQPMEIRIRGKKKALDLLVSDDILVQADLSELDDSDYGTCTLPANVTLRGFSEIGVVGSYEVQVYVD